MPLAFCTAPVVLLDKSMIETARQLNAGTERQDTKTNAWWFNCLNSKTFTLNPVLYAMEGRTRRIPTLAEFKSEFEKAFAILEARFPKARKVSFADNQYGPVFSLVSELMDRYRSEAVFLCKVAPLIADVVAANDRSDIESKIIDVSRELHVGSSRLVLLAALACLYESRSGNPPSIGRKVVKPSPDFSSRDAHNVISDLRALEFLIQVSQLPGPSVAFATRDKALAAFWCAIQPANIEKLDSKYKFDVSLKETLMPGLSEEGRHQLSERLRAADS